MNGLREGVRSEAAITQEAVIFVIALPLSFFIAGTQWVWVALIAIFLLVLAVEFLNTAIERLCDHPHPGKLKAIRITKDYASAGVFFVLVPAALDGVRRDFALECAGYGLAVISLPALAITPRSVCFCGIVSCRAQPIVRAVLVATAQLNACIVLRVLNQVSPFGVLGAAAVDMFGGIRTGLYGVYDGHRADNACTNRYVTVEITALATITTVAAAIHAFVAVAAAMRAFVAVAAAIHAFVAVAAHTCFGGRNVECGGNRG